MRRTALLLPTLVMFSFTTFFIGAWDWPFVGGFQMEPAQYVPGFTYRLVPADAETEVQTVSDGELIFSVPSYDRDGNSTSGIPRATGVSIYAHANGIVSGYFLPSRSTMSGNLPWIEFVLWDWTVGKQINPRLLLKQREDRPESELPPIRLFQDGRYVSSGEIVSGPVILAVERERFDPTRLPWEVRVIVGGERVDRHRFVFPEDFSSLSPGRSEVELFHIEARPGANTIVLEAERFDRTVERRTLRFNARPAVDSPVNDAMDAMGRP